jgi:hypothetical protein
VNIILLNVVAVHAILLNAVRLNAILPIVAAQRERVMKEKKVLYQRIQIDFAADDFLCPKAPSVACTINVLRS